jgi:hypothetical protein
MARAHARSWPGACAAAAVAAGHGGVARGSGNKVARSTVSSARGGDVVAVPTNGAEGDGGPRSMACSGSVGGDAAASTTCAEDGVSESSGGRKKSGGTATLPAEERRRG